jgi:hypothetical protein
MCPQAHKEMWFPLSGPQRSLWFLYQLDSASQGRHNNAFAALVHGELDCDTLSEALQTLITRHPMLRVRFRNKHGEPEQCFVPSATVSVTCVDAVEWPEQLLRQRVLMDCLEPFDLSRPLPIRANLYERGECKKVVLLVFDHIVGDGWSYWQILDELGMLLSDPKQDANSGRTAPDSERSILFCRYWTLKEAHAKALGLGMSLAFEKIAFELYEGIARLHGHSDEWYFEHWSPTPTHTVAIAIRTREPVHLIRHFGLPEKHPDFSTAS